MVRFSAFEFDQVAVSDILFYVEYLPPDGVPGVPAKDICLFAHCFEHTGVDLVWHCTATQFLNEETAVLRFRLHQYARLGTSDHSW